jgi:hypothetical protein
MIRSALLSKVFPFMNDQDLIAIAEQLETATDAVGAKLHFFEDNPPHSIFLSANRAGCLRLAAALLRAAVQTLLDGKRATRPSHLDDLYQHVVETRDRRLFFIERMESWPAPTEPVTYGRPPTWKDLRPQDPGTGVHLFASHGRKVGNLLAGLSLVTSTQDAKPNRGDRQRKRAA